MEVSSDIAPHGLQAVIDFVNTWDLETGAESLSSPGELGEWLAQRGLIAPSARLGGSDLERALAVREALREVLLAHNRGAAPPPAAAALLDRTAAAGELSVRFDPVTGEIGFGSRADGVAGALAELLAAAARGTADGSWDRVKVCAADDCRWAFYDRSRNRSGRWCDMAVCGNRTKVRSFRRRIGPSSRRPSASTDSA